jgi:hypothetical protein
MKPPIVVVPSFRLGNGIRSGPLRRGRQDAALQRFRALLEEAGDLRCFGHHAMVISIGFFYGDITIKHGDISDITIKNPGDLTNLDR